MGVRTNRDDGNNGKEIECQMMVATLSRHFKTQPGENLRKTRWQRLLGCGFECASSKPLPTPRLVWLIFVFVFVLAPYVALAQDSKKGLARPEWQLRADLEFRLTCQASLQKLCLELIETHSKNPADPSNAKLLDVAKELLETTDGKLPPTLPDHPASAEYIQSRKTAVIDWNKAYKAKGRELPTVALESERRFQESHRDKTEPPANSTPDESVNNPPAESKDNRTAGKDSKSAEKKLEDMTVKSLVSLIKEVDKYRSTKPAGDTTLEREQSKRIAFESMKKYVDGQPEYYFTYPIKDVSEGRNSLEFEVDEPIEFTQVRKMLGEQVLTLKRGRIGVDPSRLALTKSSSTIKPGDLLRVRFKVGTEFNFASSNSFRFQVSSSSTMGKQPMGDLIFEFTEKSIVSYQLVKKSATMERSR